MTKVANLSTFQVIERDDPPEEPGEPAGDYIDLAHTPVWGTKSHWKQPWRSYLDTVPAKTLLDGMGINFNLADQGQIKNAARLVAESGFTRVRYEIPWGVLEYTDPTKFITSKLTTIEWVMEAFKENGLRPLILLNGNSGEPCPRKAITLTLTTEGKIGDTTIKVDPAGLSQIVKGKTGVLGSSIMAYYLFTNYAEDGTITLSQPLKVALPAGTLGASILKYEPFHAVVLADGVTPNPAIETTMLGWLSYVGTVGRKVKALLGSEEFDFEVWNELSFGSAFLSRNNYYVPDPELSPRPVNASVFNRTVAYVRAAANEISGVGRVSNGFMNQSNAKTSALTPSAIGRHPYPGALNFPAWEETGTGGTWFEGGSKPLDALGNPQTKAKTAPYIPEFTPTYTAFFPEYNLCQLQTECVGIYDTAPYNSIIGGQPHGRNATAEVPAPKDTSGGLEPSGYLPIAHEGAAAPVWFTETNVEQRESKSPTKFPVPRAELSAADIRHNETKWLLRHSCAYFNKGINALYYFAVTGPGINLKSDLAIVSEAFLLAAKKVGAVIPAYPGNELGGESMEAMRTLTETFAGATAIAKPRELSLTSLTEYEGNIQWAGKPEDEERFPPLKNSDVFAFFPFQVNDSGRFVIPVYVATKNMATIYEGSGPTRFDMPEEKYRLNIGGVKGTGATVSALDPITGESTPVTTVETGASKLVVDIEVTDYPRLLTIQES